MTDSNARAKAAYALVSELALRDRVDEHALSRVTMLGEDAIPALRDAAGFRERSLRRFAVQALAAIGGRRVIAPLLNAVDDERTRDPDLTAIALRGVVAELTPDDDAKVGAFLRELSSHPDRFVRAAVADGLGRLGRAAHADVLHQLARDPDPYVAEQARGPEPAATGAKEPHDLLALIEAPDTSDHSRAIALQALRPGASIDLAALGRVLDRWSQHRDLFVRAESFAAGVRLGVPYADELLDRALRDPEPHVRDRAARAWADAGVAQSGPATPTVDERVRHALRTMEEQQPGVDDGELALLWQGLTTRAASNAYLELDLADIARRTVTVAPPATRAAARAFLAAFVGEVDAVGAPAGAATVSAWLASGEPDGLVAAVDALERSSAPIDEHLEALLRALYRADDPMTARLAALLARSTDPRATAARQRLQHHASEAVRQAAGAIASRADDGRTARALDALEAQVEPIASETPDDEPPPGGA